jgi:hypothetical protein
MNMRMLQRRELVCSLTADAKATNTVDGRHASHSHFCIHSATRLFFLAVRYLAKCNIYDTLRETLDFSDHQSIIKIIT